MTAFPRIDAHQHFWKYSKAEFGWIDETMSAIARDFAPADLEPHLRDQGIHGCVAVQARTTERENDYLLGLVRQHPWILGVVGWLDIASPDLARRLDALGPSRPLLVGFREVLQGRRTETFLNEGFVAGIRLLGELDYTYDILIYSNQLTDAAELIRRARPDQRLVLDHLGKPDIKGRGLDDWAPRIQKLARDHPNLHCKLSGMVTEASSGWTASELRPYMEVVVEAFGPRRVMYGSDWPVCLLNAREYKAVHDVAADFIDALGAEASADIFGATAQRFYKLRGPSTP